MNFLFISDNDKLKEFILNREYETHKSYLDKYDTIAKRDDHMINFFKNINYLQSFSGKERYDLVYINEKRKISNLNKMLLFLNNGSEMQIHKKNISKEDLDQISIYFKHVYMENDFYILKDYSKKNNVNHTKIKTVKKELYKIDIHDYTLNDIKAKVIDNCFSLDKATKIIKTDQIEYDIDDLHKKENILKYSKRIMDDFDQNKFSSFSNKIKTFKLTKKIISEKYTKFTASQAFLKMYEILEIFNLFDLRTRKHKSFHFCEAPGQFIMAIRYYLQSKNLKNNLDWHAQSMNFRKKGRENYFGDAYGLMRNNPQRWLFGIDDSGDITRNIIIKSYKKVCEDVQLITSDCGLGSPTYWDMTYQDKRMAYINFCQLLAILYNLKKGGNFVAKVFLPQTVDYLISINYIISKHFENLYVYKPYLNPGSSEVYLVGKNYTPLDKSMIDYLFKIKERIEKGNEDGFVKIPKIWLNKYQKVFINMIENNLVSIRKNIYFFKNQKLDKEKLEQILKDNANFWIKKFDFKELEEQDLMDILE